MFRYAITAPRQGQQFSTPDGFVVADEEGFYRLSDTQKLYISKTLGMHVRPFDEVTGEVFEEPSDEQVAQLQTQLRIAEARLAAKKNAEQFEAIQVPSLAIATPPQQVAVAVVPVVDEAQAAAAAEAAQKAAALQARNAAITASRDERKRRDAQ